MGVKTSPRRPQSPPLATGKRARAAKFLANQKKDMRRTGEAKAKRRSHDTLDGGAPGNDKIVLLVDIFDPLDVFKDDNGVRFISMSEAFNRSCQHPTPVCGACEYEFGYGKPPAALFCTRPMFPRDEAFLVYLRRDLSAARKPSIG